MVLSKMKAALAAFFNLPLEEKRKYSMAENYLQGYGQAYVVSEQQKLGWGDLIFLGTPPLEDRNMKYWPTTLPGFKEAVEECSREIERVTEEIMAKLSLLKGMDENGLKRLHVMMKQSIRMNYYPPCSRPDLVLGVSPHSNGRSITILQDDKITGLQIKYKEGWLPVKPIPNALVVNFGDVIDVLVTGAFVVTTFIFFGVQQNNQIKPYKYSKGLEQWNVQKHRAQSHHKCEQGKNVHCDVCASIPGNRNTSSEIDDAGSPKIVEGHKHLDYIKHVLERTMDGKAHTRFLTLESKP